MEGSFAVFVSILFVINKHWFHSPFIVPYSITVMLICLFWYAFMYYKLRKVDLQENLKQTLQQLIKAFDLYLKVYLYGSLVLGLFAAILPLFWKNITFIDFLNTKNIITAIVILVAIPAYYFFTKWYIKKLYGNYLNELKEELKELEDLEE
jgi:hypothetical protein